MPKFYEPDAPKRKTPLFQKRHYEWLAAFLAERRPDIHDPVGHGHWTDIVDEMEDCLSRQADVDGVNFKPKMFLEACGRV